MKRYARLQDGRIAEFFATNVDIKQLFHPSLVWVDITAEQVADIGWSFDGVAFHPPTEVPRPTEAGATLAELQRQLALLSGQLAAMTHR